MIDDARKRLGSATARLALSYLAIIMLMSIGFSAATYVTSSNELGRQLVPPALRDAGPGELPPAVEEFLEARVAEGRRSLAWQFVSINLLVLAGGAVLSYLLARKTLEPIEDAMRRQSQFISDASHELRTPLTSLQLSNEIALRKPDLTATEARDTLQANVDEAGKLKNLTDGLLRLAAAEPPDLTLSKVPVQQSLAGALNEVINVATARDIAVDDQSRDLSVLADPVLLEQILVILLDNAIKYSEPGSTVHITTGVKNKHASIYIRDEGIGIRASDLEHIFTRFYRADTSRSKEKRDGYGLGLAIARQLAEQMDGKISVTSRPGKGSTFAVSLPVA